jgi:hypothetical protein
MLILEEAQTCLLAGVGYTNWVSPVTSASLLWAISIFTPPFTSSTPSRCPESEVLGTSFWGCWICPRTQDSTPQCYVAGILSCHDIITLLTSLRHDNADAANRPNRGKKKIQIPHSKLLNLVGITSFWHTVKIYDAITKQRANRQSEINMQRADGTKFEFPKTGMEDRPCCHDLAYIMPLTKPPHIPKSNSPLHSNPTNWLPTPFPSPTSDSLHLSPPCRRINSTRPPRGQAISHHIL